nr:copper-binding protein [uncultured Roseateles sp.]
MNTLKQLTAAALVVLTSLGAVAQAELTEGEIRKVDKSAQKLTIKHGEIKPLDMPAMTMVFQVKDPAMLDQVKAGDKVRFKVEHSSAGFIVTELQPAR